MVEPSTRLKPLKVAFFTIVVIWSRRAVKSAFSAWRLAVSSEGSAAESAFARRDFRAALAVCPAAWTSKKAFLETQGYRAAKMWLLKRA